MAIVDLFSKRQKRLRGEVHDVYTYDDLPEPLRVQIVHLWSRALDKGDRYSHLSGYATIARILCEEYGCFQLPGKKYPHSRSDELVGFVLRETDVERVLDAIEQSFRYINYDQIISAEFHYRTELVETAKDVTNDLNSRFKEHGVGYQFVDGRIVRVDSEYLHSEALRPALRVLRKKRYAGAQQEFLSAHQRYRKGETKEALNDCLKAFESVMKAICGKRSWNYPNNVTASRLIDICLKKDLIPAFWQSHYSSLRSTLESGVPTARNKQSAHGQGTTPEAVPDHLAAYVLNMTASAIVFLTEAEAQLP